MGPRTYIRGNIQMGHESLQTFVASMGPRTYIRGNVLEPPEDVGGLI